MRRDLFARHTFLAIILASRKSMHFSHDVMKLSNLIPTTFGLNLNPLTKEESKKMIVSLLNVVHVDPEITSLIFEKSKGHPLFAQTLINLLQNEGNFLKFSKDGVSCTMSGEIESYRDDLLKLPHSISGLLMQRIDQLSRSAQITLKIVRSHRPF